MAQGRVTEERQQWRQTLETLRLLCPPAHPVEVRRVKMPKDLWGDCQLKTRPRKHFRIRIDRTAKPLFQLEVLLHEWAHALAWTEAHQTVRSHDPEWGLAYARVYQAVVEE